MLFSEVIGQFGAKKMLVQSVQNSTMAHAQLVLGTEGSGGLAIALAFAQYIHCENRTPEDSCGTCPGCIKSAQFIHPDTHFTFPFITNPSVKKKSDEKPICADWMSVWRKVIKETPYLNVFQWMQHLDAENKQANITAGECVEIIKKSSFKAFESAYKIFIIWMPEYLDKEGNKLLKLLEEPPENTLFLLVAEDEKDILATILSRTQLVKLPPLQDQEIEQALLIQKNVEPSKAAQLSKIANGNYLAALELLADSDFDSDQLVVAWMDMLFYQKRTLWVDFADQFQKMGREKQKYFLASCLTFIRQAVLLQQMQLPSALWNEQELALNKALVASLTIRKFEKWAAIIDKMQSYVERNGNPKILCLNASIHIARIMQSPAGTLSL